MKTFASIILVLLHSCSLFAQLPALERVEPMNWWVGMSNPKLQLIIHGDKISERTVKLSYPGVKLEKVHKAENPNYLFVDLEIGPAAKAGSFPILFSKAGKKDLSYTYKLSSRDRSPGRIQGVNSSDLIYLIMPDRFANGDQTNDVINGMRETTLNRDSIYHRHGGDIQGLMNNLGYLKNTGVTAIWCTPEIENDMPQASYHGYAATDHYKIDPRFGTNEL